MGDRITTYYQCECGGQVEEYDAPSSLIFNASCNKCGWHDPRSYYETDENTIELLTVKQAIAMGLLRIERLRVPFIETRYGGPALADEVFDALDLMTDKINEIIDCLNDIEETQIKTPPKSQETRLERI